MASFSGAVLVEMILTPMYILRPSILGQCQSCIIMKWSILFICSSAPEGDELEPPGSPLFSRSLSAPSKLDRSASVEQGIQDVLRLQRWRTAVQRKHSQSDDTDAPRDSTFVSTIDDIFAFIGSDPEKAVRQQLLYYSFWQKDKILDSM